MKYSDIPGHDEIKAALRQMVRTGRLPHALLLSGAEGSVALPVAMATAQYVNCRSRTDDDSCGSCPECYKMERLEHPDVHYIYPVNTSKEAVSTGRSDEKPTSEQFLHLWRRLIGETAGTLTEQEWYAALDIENKQGNINKSEANELVRKMGFKAFEGGYKTVILWLPERMHDTAANALLKLVEEPPARTLFFFVSAEPDKIIATIRSRTQHIALPGLAAGGVNEQQAELFIRLMRLCYGSKFIELFDWADEMASLGREQQKQFCAAGTSVLRSCYLLGVGMPQIAGTPEAHIQFCRNFAPYVSEVSIEPLIAEFELLLTHLRRNGNPKILFTHFAMSVSKIISHARSHLAAGQ